MNVSPRDDSSSLYLPGRQLTEYPGTEVVEERSVPVRPLAEYLQAVTNRASASQDRCPKDLN
jgi:hypothetical protein